jgi:membrane protease YdiL (CAAX protease family)
MIGKFCFEADMNSRGYLYMMQFINTSGTFFLPALLFSYCATKNWFSYNEANKIFSSTLIVYVLIISLFILPIIACLGYLNEQILLPESMQKLEMWMQKMEETNKILIQTLTANSTISVLFLNIILMALFPAIFEEFLFRGTLQQFFSKWFTNKHLAIIITAFIFSAIHFQFYGFIPRFVLGIYLGYLFVWSRSLWLPIIAHFMHNTLSLIFDYGAQRRNIDIESIVPNQIQGFYWIVSFCVICVTVGVYKMYKWRE